MALRVLSWNLMHGRSVPAAGHDLFEEFAAALARWEWDVVLLQEVPPWWSADLQTQLGGEQRLVLTSRNALLPVRRAIATRWPDLIKSNGGGSNAILARRGEVIEHRTFRLCWRPERRWVHAIRFETADSPTPVWIGNLHATVHDADAAKRDARLAARALLEWADDEPLVLGGDFNVRRPAIEGLVHAGGFDVDHIFVRGFVTAGEPEVLDRGQLSDHAPVAVTLDVATVS